MTGTVIGQRRFWYCDVGVESGASVSPENVYQNALKVLVASMLRETSFKCHMMTRCLERVSIRSITLYIFNFHDS